MLREVVAQLRLQLRRHAALGHDLVEGGGHVPEPGVPLGLADHERGVALAEARVPPLLAVGAGTAPVLLEEQRQVLDGVGEVVGVERPQQRVGRDPGVEALDEVDEERLPAHRVEHAEGRSGCSLSLTATTLPTALRAPATA